jgi:hypothetical protein
VGRLAVVRRALLRRRPRRRRRWCGVQRPELWPPTTAAGDGGGAAGAAQRGGAAWWGCRRLGGAGAPLSPVGAAPARRRRPARPAPHPRPPSLSSAPSLPPNPGIHHLDWGVLLLLGRRVVPRPGGVVHQARAAREAPVRSREAGGRPRRACARRAGNGGRLRRPLPSAPLRCAPLHCARPASPTPRRFSAALKPGNAAGGGGTTAFQECADDSPLPPFTAPLLPPARSARRSTPKTRRAAAAPRPSRSASSSATRGRGSLRLPSSRGAPRCRFGGRPFGGWGEGQRGGALVRRPRQGEFAIASITGRTTRQVGGVGWRRQLGSGGRGAPITPSLPPTVSTVPRGPAAAVQRLRPHQPRPPQPTPALPPDPRGPAAAQQRLRPHQPCVRRGHLPFGGPRLPAHEHERARGPG